MYKQNPRSPVAKALKGNQNKLPQGLKSAIASAPESPAKAMTGPDVQKEAGNTGTAGANSAKGTNAPSKAQTPNRSYAPGTAESKFNTSSPTTGKTTTGTTTTGKTSTGSTPKKKPAYDKELNTLVASRKGLKKGTAEYNTIQNQINAKLGSKKVHGRGTATSTDLKKKEITLKTSTTGKPAADKTAAVKPAKTKTLISGESRNPVGELNLADAPKTQKLVQDPKKVKSVKVKQTAAGTTMTTKTGGGAKKGGTTQRRKVTKTGDKTVTKTANTRTVTKTDKAGKVTNKETKRLGKGRIKEALANRKEARNNKKALKQTKKANVSVDGTPSKPRGKSMVNATSPAKKGYDGVATGGSKPKPKATPGQRKATKALRETISTKKPAAKAVKVQATPKPKASKAAMAQIKVISDKIAAKNYKK